MKNTIIITAPSLNENLNVSGISSVTKFIIANNKNSEYIHFELGKTDNQNRGVGWFFNILRAYMSWCRTLLSKKNIVVHFNFALEKRSIIRDSPFILAARIFNKKMVIHLHGGKYLMQEPPGWIKKLLKIVLVNKEPKVVLSAFEKETILKKFKTENIHVLPNSVSLSESRTFQRLYPSKRPLNLLFMGRIVESKGMLYLYEACALLLEKGIHFNFYLAGKGPEQNKYVQSFSSLLGDRFFFEGVVSGSGKTSLIEACDVFLLPSLSGEGLPMALLECMSFGLVPVTTDDGSMGHVVENGKTGFIVKKHSAEDIVTCIQNLDECRTLLQTLGANSKRHIEDNYNPEVYINELNGIYALAR